MRWPEAPELNFMTAGGKLLREGVQAISVF